jgi:hypothetical protein
MKYFVVLVCFLIANLSIAKEQNMASIDKVSKNIQLFIAPSNEDQLETFEKVCNCIAVKASSSWGDKKFSVFSDSLADYAHLSTKAMSDMESMLKNGSPRPSPNLLSGLTELSVFVAECEKKYGISVEM